ncbi:MAG: ABC transporter ATP-binding protein [Nitrospirae bacterium]|nr:ABC transporter ATP-binding protein [Nitrospirota bacterium]
MLKLIKVNVVYGRNKKKLQVLKDVDFHLGEGEFITVTGPSGSGKTTFVQICGGLSTPTSGVVEFNGQKMHEINDDRLSAIRNTSIGFVFQNYNLVEYLTALENVELPLMFRKIPAKERKDSAREMLYSLGLKDRMGHYPAELSGGECQRVAIARALVVRPRLIIADEPTGNLDSENSKHVMEIIVRIFAENRISIILVTHNPWIADYGTRRIKIESGVLL